MKKVTLKISLLKAYLQIPVTEDNTAANDAFAKALELSDDEGTSEISGPDFAVLKASLEACRARISAAGDMELHSMKLLEQIKTLAQLQRWSTLLTIEYDSRKNTNSAVNEAKETMTEMLGMFKDFTFKGFEKLEDILKKGW